MSSPRSAVATFVKTPGLSPVKTRLAQTVGKAAAESAYEKLVDIVRSTLREAAVMDEGIEPWWAVAEPLGLAHAHWSDYQRIAQPEGDLGARIAGIYDGLRGRGFEQVMLIGADCPLLVAQTLVDTHQFLAAQSNEPQVVIGRAEDGGFYLFAANCPVPSEIWTSIEFSSEKTSEQLLAKVAPFATVHELPVLFDIDTDADYQRYVNYMRGSFKTF
jgi:glycosyltransferase A (GT-A) superfamily protein (DUF2064 family)